MTTNFEEKRQARIDRLKAAATKAAAESDHVLNQAHKMAECIPFGQPILVGHHSEKRDRNYRGRIESKHRQGFELMKKADYYADRAAAAEKNTAIFSDDPAAAEKIEAKIERLEKRQELMKAANKLVRKNDREGLLNLGFTESNIDKLFKPDFCGRIGFPDYEITNNGANIRRLKERSKTIQAHSQDESKTIEINGIQIIDNVEENRLQIKFPGKPADDIRQQLKSRGFRWSPTFGTWQRQRSNAAMYAAKTIVEALK